MTILKAKSAMPSFMPGFWNDLFDDEHRAENYTRPAVNVKETEDDFQLEFAAPGMNKKDFEINVDQDLLTVKADHEMKKKHEDGTYTMREFSYSSFKRTFTLPESVKADDINASYENGILKVMLPKKEEAKPQPKRSISVK